MKRTAWCATAALLVTLTACGGGDDTETADASNPPADDATTADDGTAAETTDSGDGTDAGAAPSGEYRFAASLGPRSWDPSPESRQFALGWYDFVYDGLLRFDASGELAPGLATEWNLTPESMELTLRSDVTFHDGTPFDAEAVAWNIERAQADAGLTGQALAPIDTVTVVDEDEVVLELSEPAPDLAHLLASFPGLMVSPGIDQADLEAGTPAGTGPYVLDVEASKPDSEWVFTAAEDFWDPSVHRFETVHGLLITDDAARANALTSGQVDSSFVRASQIEQATATGAEVSTAPTNYSVFQIMDLDGTIVPEFADPKVRQALAHAIDRDAFVQVALSGQGTPTDQLFAEGQTGYSDSVEPLAYDPDAAKALLEEAGAANLEFTVVAFGPFLQGAQVLQGMFAEVGVTMNIETTAPGEMTPKIASGEVAAVYTYVPDPHPHTVYSKQLAPGAVYNAFDAEVPAVSESIATIADGAEGGALDQAYADAFSSVYEQGWITPIAVNTNSIAYDPNTITGVEAWTGVASFLYTRGIAPA